MAFQDWFKPPVPASHSSTLRALRKVKRTAEAQIYSTPFFSMVTDRVRVALRRSASPSLDFSELSRAAGPRCGSRKHAPYGNLRYEQETTLEP